MIDQFYSAIEGMGSCSLMQMQEKQEEFEVQEKDFALEEVPASKTGSNSRSENITMDNGNEWYYFTYLGAAATTISVNSIPIPILIMTTSHVSVRITSSPMMLLF